MPYLKSVLIQATARELRYLRGKAMEAISLIAVAVGKQTFAPDAKEVLAAMLQAQTSPMEADDPQISYLQQAWARLCKALGQDFVPYLPHIIPNLLAAASIQPHIILCNRMYLCRLLLLLGVLDRLVVGVVLTRHWRVCMSLSVRV
jgi:importin-5